MNKSNVVALTYYLGNQRKRWLYMTDYKPYVDFLKKNIKKWILFIKKRKNIVDSKLRVYYTNKYNKSTKSWPKGGWKMSARLKAFRKLKGLTQADVANELGILYTTYSLKENGKQDFSLPEAKKIADLFNLTIDEVFFSQEVNIKFTKVL